MKFIFEVKEYKRKKGKDNKTYRIISYNDTFTPCFESYFCIEKSKPTFFGLLSEFVEIERFKKLKDCLYHFENL